ncbi:proteasome maturation protein-like [Liolophura sinensis]|uniref:proteasome maturation protein-like n=1 Tax=Liolophura sinensis TaxID=3198878 RepID=UPI003158AD40
MSDKADNMSLGHPSVRPQPPGDHVVSLPHGPYGTPDMMLHGPQNVKSRLSDTHPLEFSEQQWRANQQHMDLGMLRNSQGLHAPLKLQMERQTALKMRRLPGLHSSDIMINTLTGLDEMITFEDILNNPADAETMGNPHVLMEKRLNLL